MDYLSIEKENFLTEKSKYFKDDDYNEVRALIDSLDANAFEKVLNAGLKKPSTMVMISVLLGGAGIDRFMMGDNLAGVIKFLTSGGMLIWWIADIFTASKRAKEYNINSLRMIVRSGASMPTVKNKWDNIKNNKELQKTIIRGAKNISSATKDLHNTMYSD